MLAPFDTCIAGICLPLPIQPAQRRLHTNAASGNGSKSAIPDDFTLTLQRLFDRHDLNDNGDDMQLYFAMCFAAPVSQFLNTLAITKFTGY